MPQNIRRRILARRKRHIRASETPRNSHLFLPCRSADFSGYCDIALGSSRILGIDLSRNFDRPYFSRSVLEFWHRWHISLMRWFTDYVYIPLGGSRRGTIRTASNIAAVFLLSGLWHGASITFVTWGVYWAIIYILARFLFNAAGYRRYPLPPERSDALKLASPCLS